MHAVAVVTGHLSSSAMARTRKDELAEAVETFSSTTVYRVDEPTHVEHVDGLGERFEVDFTAGRHTPRSEREEVALEHLYHSGLASRDGERFVPIPPVEQEPEAPAEVRAEAPAIPGESTAAEGEG